jgi:(2Fe-2S) ferredoxin
MSRRAGKMTGPVDGQGSGRCTVGVCRGCCCGTPKIPGIDHPSQLARLRTAVGAGGQVRVTDCLDACEHANVIVVQPSPAGRAAGGRPVWLGLVNDQDAADDIAAWIEAGGPGLAEPPGILDLYAFTPSRRIRRRLD